MKPWSIQTAVNYGALPHLAITLCRGIDEARRQEAHEAEIADLRLKHARLRAYRRPSKVTVPKRLTLRLP